MCLSRTAKRWISVLVSIWSVFQNTVTYGNSGGEFMMVTAKMIMMVGDGGGGRMEGALC